MIQTGDFNNLKVLRLTDIGAYLDDGKDGILLPKRFMPINIKEGDDINVFIYHDSEDRLIATTQIPLGIVGDIVKLKVVSITPQGAFMDMGLMKDLFVPKSRQIHPMRPNGEYIVKIYRDHLTNRIAGTQKFDNELSNEDLTVKELDIVNLLAYRRTDIGYLMIINNKHTGVLHFNEIYRPISEGASFKGYIKKIYPATNNIDVAAGTPGYRRVENETDKIIDLLQKNDGFLPFHDKSNAEEIYETFAMSKKTFKMTIGNLYKQKKIAIEKDGIRLL